MAENWLASLEGSGSSASTLEAYRNDVVMYLDWLGTEQKSLIDVITADVAGYLNRLKESGYSHSTVERNRASIRSMHQHLVVEGTSTHNPTRALDRMVSQKTLPDILTEDSIARLLDAAHAEVDNERLSLELGPRMQGRQRSWRRSMHQA